MLSSGKYTASKTLAMLQCKCPRCQSGPMFKHSSTKLTKFMQMHEFCPQCNLRFEIEPGFFWGAMYVSYAITTGLMLITCAILVWGFNDPDFWVYVTCIVTVMLGSLPWVFRYSRMLMLYVFSPIRFNRDLINQ
jgi:uncharacterized protein (DUF983 family)